VFDMVEAVKKVGEKISPRRKVIGHVSRSSYSSNPRSNHSKIASAVSSGITHPSEDHSL
jgi:hypothetical protein